MVKGFVVALAAILAAGIACATAQAEPIVETRETVRLVYHTATPTMVVSESSGDSTPARLRTYSVYTATPRPPRCQDHDLHPRADQCITPVPPRATPHPHYCHRNTKWEAAKSWATNTELKRRCKRDGDSDCFRRKQAQFMDNIHEWCPDTFGKSGYKKKANNGGS